MSDKKFREWVIYEVLPEEGSGAARCLGATEGRQFVQQDSWIGNQVKVIEATALAEKDKVIAELVEAGQLFLNSVSNFDPDNIPSIYETNNAEKNFKSVLAKHKGARGE